MSMQPAGGSEEKQPSLLETVIGIANAIGTWVVNHREEIEAFAVFSRVLRVAEATKLYLPQSPAWTRIADAAGDDASPDELEALVLSIYGPGGDSYGVVCDEIKQASLLRTRLREVNEVLDSVSDARYYVAICGTLPLVEGVLASAHGRWKKHLKDYPILTRLDSEDGLTREEETDLLLNQSALTMLLSAPDTIWKSGRTSPGAVTASLNRHGALHGTAQQWDTVENATRGLLLLAAAARIAGPLLSPRSSTSD